VRREVLRGYVPIEERLGVLKGKWRLATQCRSAGGWRKDIFDVAYDEFTEDNLPNQLLKAAVERVAAWARWAETRRYLTQLRGVYADVAEKVPTAVDFDAADAWMLGYRRHAGAGRVYRPLLNMARMFMAGSSSRLSVGKTDSFAFVFNMNELFEEFVAEFIRRGLREFWAAKGWRMQSQKAGRALLFDGEQRKLFWLKPDKEYPNCTTMSREFAMSKRTLKRDIEFMKDRLKMPIAFDVQKNGYYFTRPQPHFPTVPLSEKEIVWLFVAQKTIEQHQRTSLQPVVEAAFRKMTLGPDDSVKFSMGNLDEVLSIRPFGAGDAERERIEPGVRLRDACDGGWRVKIVEGFVEDSSLRSPKTSCHQALRLGGECRNRTVPAG
jgi:hypothetical protein